MRVIILGVSGMIGHRLFFELSDCFETYGLLHRKKKQYLDLPFFLEKNIIENVDVINFEILKGVLIAIDPDVIINCVGITKRKEEIQNSVEVITINSLFPHALSDWGKMNNKRVIHFSTDCVFNGKTGNYTEDSLTTAEDVYGRTKALGEIKNHHCLTIRSSFIGQELFGKTELLEWLLAQKGKKVCGFTNTFYSGVSTAFMARVVKSVISDFPTLSGLYQLATETPISKFDLLCIARDAYNLDVDIIPDEKHVHNPTLNGAKLKETMQLKVPVWNMMMKELASIKDFYTI
jgi:dTDP-4-dehydrorhamnose reductase